MYRTVGLMCMAGLLITISSAAPNRPRRGYFVAPVPVPVGAASFQKGVFVSVRDAGDAAGCRSGPGPCSGSGSPSSSPSTPTELKPVPVAVPVPFTILRPVPVPYPVPVPAPQYQQTKPVVVGGGTGGSTSSFVSTFHINSGQLIDNIFNIPISVLRSVNQLLRNSFRGGATVQVHAVKGFYGPAIASGNTTPISTGPSSTSPTSANSNESLSSACSPCSSSVSSSSSASNVSSGSSTSSSAAATSTSSSGDSNGYGSSSSDSANVI